MRGRAGTRHRPMTKPSFVDFLEQGELSEQAHERFNAPFEGTRDYIVTHYKTNTRTDTEYWRANATNRNLSDELKQLYAQWMSGQGIAAPVAQQQLGKGYPVFSWYSLMCGMGIFPEQRELRAPSAQEARFNMAALSLRGLPPPAREAWRALFEHSCSARRHR